MGRRVRFGGWLLAAVAFGLMMAASPARAQCISIGDSCHDGDPCTVEDRCVGICVAGVCIGDECAGTAGCSDGDACTADSCDPGVGCVHAPISCEDSNPCTTDRCDPITGCQHDPVTCNDSNFCTTDSCDPVAGCRNDAIGCDDGNPCTTDGCDPDDGCRNDPIACDDGNPCTSDTCDSVAGCQHQPISCEDGNPCTNDSCDPAEGCRHDPVGCSDGNACTNDSCNPQTGCVHEGISCLDGNACTADTCDPASGCQHTPIACDDQNACTADRCDSGLGCLHDPIDCGDDDACTVDFCVPQAGCGHGPRSCDDRNACTTDRCDRSTGCTHGDVDCDDGNPCTIEVCDPGEGCLAPTPALGKLCDDGNSCTVFDSCDEDGRCRGAPVQCPDDACSTNRVCVDGECRGGTGIDCGDGTPCTIDTCDLGQGGCQHEPSDALCADGDPCTAKSCDADDGCVKSPLTGPACDDADACTSGDACQAGTCVGGERRQCADAPCFTDRVCLAGDCVGGLPVGCNDRLNCTEDSCDPERGCVFTPSDARCISAGQCFAGVCDPTSGCRQQPLSGTSCDDGDGCTSDDRCSAGTCRGTPVTCEADAFECTNDTCVDGACRHIATDTLCERGDCELGACRPGDAGADRRGCVREPVEEGEACTDDGFACTDDVCTGRQCLHVPIDSRCGAPEECTRTVCSPEQEGSNQAGCVVSPLEALAVAQCAEDGDPCTDDQCSESRCLHRPVQEFVTCAPVLGAFRRALGLTSLTRGLMAEVEGANQPSGTGGGSGAMAGLATRLERVGTDLMSASGALSGKITDEEQPNVPRTFLPETPAQQRARIAFVQVRRTPRQVQNFLRLVTEAQARAALRREHARALRRRGRLLLRGTKTLKGELKRLQQVSKSFAR